MTAFSRSAALVSAGLVMAVQTREAVGQDRSVATSSDGATFSERIHGVVFEASGAFNTKWLRGVVLFRVSGTPLPFGSPQDVERKARSARARTAWNDRGDAARTRFCGGGASNEWWYGVECSINFDTLMVVNDRIPLPNGDSILVVLVEQPDVDPATWRLVGTAGITAEVPAAYWPVRWTSGDTLFTSRHRRPEGVLLEHLRRHERVRRFLDGR
jgi:hypothetical protein